MSDGRVVLQAGPMTLGLLPELGGRLGFLRHEGCDLLRPADEAAIARDGVLAGAGFPMMPFCGRIRDGMFTWDGKVHCLEPNFAPEPHAIHGHVWQRAWQVATRGAADAALVLRTDAGGHWPWAIEARQIFRLYPDGMDLTLELTNRGQNRMPAAMGWHPYFLRLGAWLQADTHAAWIVDVANPHGRPCAPGPDKDLRAGREVANLRLDHAFDVGQPGFTVRTPAHEIIATPDPVFRGMIVYVPDGRDFFCAEPISAAPDAVNAPLPASQTGLQVLEPEQTLSGTIRLRVHPA